MNVPPENIAKLLKLAEIPEDAKQLTAWGLPCDFSSVWKWIGGIIVEVPSENSDRLKYQYIGGRIICGQPEICMKDVEFPPREDSFAQLRALENLQAHAPSLMLWI